MNRTLSFAYAKKLRVVSAHAQNAIERQAYIEHARIAGDFAFRASRLCGNVSRDLGLSESFSFKMGLPRSPQPRPRGVREVQCYVKIRGVQLGNSFQEVPQLSRIAVQLKECVVKMFTACNVLERCDLLNAQPLSAVHRRRTNDS